MILVGKLIYSFCVFNMASPFAKLLRKYYPNDLDKHNFEIVFSIMILFSVLGSISNSFLGTYIKLIMINIYEAP